MAKSLFKEERSKKRLDGWFYIKEIQRDCESRFSHLPKELKSAEILREVVKRLPISISEFAIFAGTQDDAFARSYALINPSFKVETFAGYCDPTAVFNDIEPNEEITRERIEEIRAYNQNTEYIRALSDTYGAVEKYTGEVVFFIEQVTGHVIPDVRPLLKHGATGILEQIDNKLKTTTDETKRINYEAMKITLDALCILASRYADLALELIGNTHPNDEQRRIVLNNIYNMLLRVPKYGARTLMEAVQSFILIWQLMCIEQSPNPYAFSAGNADRIFEPYRAAEGLSREEASAILKHFLVFFNVADRSWAISQNIIVSGRDVEGNDLTNLTSYALLDAYYDMNLPQPILSVKLHKNTPTELYQSLGRFFFTPGCLTPSLFNDDAVFETLRKAGIEEADLPDYSIAGCQEPLIMGKDNGNTTNSWLNLGKILELTLNDGVSTVTGNRIGEPSEPVDAVTLLRNIRERFFEQVEKYTNIMVEAANNASRAISLLPVPFLSTMMGGIETGYDMRDTEHQGTKYNGSGCLIHGLTVVSDSFVAIDCLLKDRPQDAERLLEALRTNFEHDEELHQYLRSCPKFGNNNQTADSEAAQVAERVAKIVAARKNYLGNPFRPDFSTPSTHLTYGYWVGATPDGRKARDMLNYGIDPLYGDAHNGLGFRTLSTFNLPFGLMNGGYASHFGVDPRYFRSLSYEEKGLDFYKRVISPLFFNKMNNNTSPFYLYVNVTTPDILRKVLEQPEVYAPSGIYIMRIHGTFVNFLDLSPAIQQDIITRLDLESTAI
jgi:formate C-acetyltransferase